MNLSISHKYEVFDENFWNDHIPAFDPKKNKLTTVNANFQGLLVTDLEEIAKHVNRLAKPIFTEVDKFYNCFRNIEKINDLMQSKGSNLLIDTKPFCLALRPSFKELKKNLWAVHVSDHLWQDAIIKPFIKKLGSKKHVQGISLTVHLTLGEMVRPHSYIHNWKYRQFAIITPLSELYHKLIGIYPYDSYIHGEWKITPKAIVIVPKETVVPEIYFQEELNVVTYDSSSTSLRKVIKNQIIEQQGIYLRMVRNLILPGSPAYLYGNRKININKMQFFESILQKNKKISFGPDTNSLNDRISYCFGIVRQFSCKMYHLADKDRTNSLLEDLYSYFQFSYEKIKHELTTCEQEKITDFLHQFSFCKEIKSGKISDAATDILCNLNSNELMDFKSQFPGLFNVHTNYIVDATWAVKRWLMVGREQGIKENLEDIYKQNLKTFLSQHNAIFMNSNINDVIARNLEEESERADLALYILNIPETRDYNWRVANQILLEKREKIIIVSRNGSYFSTDYSAESIESALSQYTKTAVLFRDNYILPTIEIIRSYLTNPQDYIYDKESEEKLEIFTKLLPIKLETNLQTLKNSFSNICHAIEFIPNSDGENEIYTTKIRDIASLPKSILMPWKSLYGAHQLWRMFKLEKEFESLFENEQLFWNSEETFIGIYRKLKQASL